MAQGKNKIYVYRDWLNNFEDLTDEELGKLMRHFFEYVNDLNPVLEDRLLNLVWKPIESTLKRDLKKWEEKSEKNRESARMRWDKNNANASERKKRNAKNADSDKDSDSVSDSNKLDFVKLLSFINDKTGRQFRTINNKVKQKFKARLKDGYTKEDIQSAIVNACNASYHIENGKQYLTPEFFSRSDTLDKYGSNTTQNAEQSPNVVKSPKFGKYVR